MASQAHSGALGGGDAGDGPGQALVGNVGQEYVQATLTTMDPVTAIQVGAGAGAGRAGAGADGRLAAGARALSGGGGAGVRRAEARQAVLGRCAARPARLASAVQTAGIKRARPPPPPLAVPALQDIQARGALQDPRCLPLIGLLDQLGLTRCAGCTLHACTAARAGRTVPRARARARAIAPACSHPPARPPAFTRHARSAESHRHVLQAATRELLARVATMQPDRLLQLLEVGAGRCPVQGCRRHWVLHRCDWCALGAGWRWMPGSTAVLRPAALVAGSARRHHNGSCTPRLPLPTCLPRPRSPTSASRTCAACRWRCWTACSRCRTPSSSSWPQTWSCSGSCRWACSVR